MGRCGHPKGWHISLQGRDETGAFRTAVAKVYPPGLNAALSDAIAEFAAPFAPFVQWVDPLDSALAPMLTYDFVNPSTVQPDFYG